MTHLSRLLTNPLRERTAARPSRKLRLEPLEGREAPAVLEFIGMGNDGGKWTNSANFRNTATMMNAAPQTGDKLIFDGAIKNADSTNDNAMIMSLVKITTKGGYNKTIEVGNLMMGVGTVEQDGGTIQAGVGKTLSINTEHEFKNGTIGPGTVDLKANANASFGVDGATLTIDNGLYDVHGTVTWSKSSVIQLKDGGITVSANGVFSAGLLNAGGAIDDAPGSTPANNLFKLAGGTPR